VADLGGSPSSSGGRIISFSTSRFCGRVVFGARAMGHLPIVTTQTYPETIRDATSQDRFNMGRVSVRWGSKSNDECGRQADVNAAVFMKFDALFAG